MAVPVTTPATTFLAVRIATTTALTAVIVSRYVRMGKPLRLARFTEERSVLPVARRTGVELDHRPTTSSAYIATTYRRRQGPCCVGTIPDKIDGWPYYRHPRGQNVRATAEKIRKNPPISRCGRGRNSRPAMVLCFIDRRDAGSLEKNGRPPDTSYNANPK